MEMDSPPNKSSKPSATTNNTATETALAQDSPVFNFISSLSPIQPVKAPPVTQGFPGLNSPPLIFRSPRLNRNSQPIFLKRAHFLGLSAAKLSEVDEGCKNDVVVNASEKLVAQLSSRLTTCTEKASDCNSPVNDPNESPKECPDQFLTDVVNMDSADPNVSAESATEKSKHIDQPPDAVTDSKESVGKPDQESDIRINDEIAGVPPVISRQVKEVHKDYTSVDVIALETDVNQDNSISVDHCQKVERELPSDSALTIHDQELQHVKKEQAGPLDRPSNSTSGSVQIGKENENFVYSTGGICETAMKTVQHNFEALQHRGIRRRCLQFEDVQHKAISNQPDCLQFEDVQHKAISNQPVQNATESGDLTSQSSETQLTPINGNQAAVEQPVNPRGMSSTIKVPKPSGIGLHLNSILNAVQPGCSAVVNVKSAQRVNFCIRGKKSMSIINSYAADNSKNSSVSPPVESVSASLDGNRHENHASVAANWTNSLSCTVNPPNNSVISNPVEDQSTPCNKRKCNFENDGSGEFKSSPKKKRKKSSDSNDGDGCKRCNCKKSKCLKLYCDCFAAGIYCAETCSCQGCFNRPEYENMVLETRQQIESRNPLAFAPKVVQHITEPPGSSYGEDGTHFTPSSARHKRGCNCKKSMCLKKYCECYQANVGCSDGCRCEGCKNVYGKKGEYGMIKGVIGEVDANEQTESSFAEKMAVASESGLYQTTELCDPHNLTPLTPALQFLNYGDGASRAWFHSGKYFQSPESNLPHVAPYMMSPVSPRNSENNNAISLETAKGILDQVSFDQELEFHDIRNPQEGANNPKTLSFAGNNNCFSAGSLHWRGSPNTPMAESSGTKLVHQIVVSDAELSNFMQDDTPEILKDSPSPRNAVKVSSPNKKRVSPPHGRPHELSSSSSSAGLRTGRKFILKAVPSFPPLTPCIDSKNIALQQTNDSRNSTAKK